jgi:hypothetical protein
MTSGSPFIFIFVAVDLGCLFVGELQIAGVAARNFLVGYHVSMAKVLKIPAKSKLMGLLVPPQGRSFKTRYIALHDNNTGIGFHEYINLAGKRL